MNSGRLAILFFLSAIIYAAYRHEQAIGRHANYIERVTSATKTLKPLLKPGSEIKVENATDIYFFPAASRYVLAPAFVSFSHDRDTILSFAPKEKPLTEQSSGRQMIWQQTDDKYQYSLSVKP